MLFCNLAIGMASNGSFGYD
ncbi:hypothetical protein F383_11460 [Gossypium arboreum]|uniref:Uncharacterized protein n=1 Tax=Gossypium arboreum TaxID=29729 RepID=A0A0B0NCV2_GOSAR|nr:hypothetical protein F383_11460 [Gossypium arboreum]